MKETPPTAKPAPARRRSLAGKSPKGAPRRRDEEVLEAAARVFYRRGYADASVQDVADEIGILKGSLYHYIKTKEDLLFRLLEGVHEEVGTILREVAAVPDLAPLDRLHLYVSRQVEYNARNLMRISIYYHDVARLSDERRRAIYKQRGGHEAFVAELIRQAQAAGEVDPEQDPQLLANCAFGNVIWVYRWYNPKGRLGPQALAKGAADFVVGGIRHSGAAAAAPAADLAA
ncbi:MAG: TetR/AcrR family transcriptional regulator [Solirubrobacteraceae bacterium]|nr:TetR/AcrR family transcriptional regulator [Patulibacter sp.]